MLVLILTDVKYLQNVAFSFEKSWNSRNHSSNSHQFIKIPSVAKFIIMPPPQSEGEILPLTCNAIWKTMYIICTEKYMYICMHLYALWTHSQSIISFYTSWNQQKICGFLILSGVIKGEHCGMEWKNVLTCLLHVCNTIKIYQIFIVLRTCSKSLQPCHIWKILDDMSSLLGKIWAKHRLLSEALISSPTDVSRFCTLTQV